MRKIRVKYGNLTLKRLLVRLEFAYNVWIVNQVCKLLVITSAFFLIASRGLQSLQ